MKLHQLLAVASLTLFALSPVPAEPNPELLPERDRKRVEEFRARSSDWRNGGVVYQIFVDRFAPSQRLEAKRSLYAAPRKLRPWSESPKPGPYLDKDQVWSHEVDYWGGDLASLRSKLDYLQELGVDIIYLNPIFESLTNHKYDASDYHKVDPVYGSRQELGQLADELHRRKMRLILDGVFNHMGRKSPYFQEARKNPQSPWREFFRWRSPTDAIGWLDVENLPELNMENPKVQDYIYRTPTSVVQSYLREEKIDGWRLDVAFDLGFRYLSEITEAAHQARPGSAVIGEIWSYPEDWHPAVDAVMNMHGRAILLKLLDGTIPGPLASSMWETAVEEAGYEHILKAWIVLDNHDTPRLNHVLPQPWQLKLARVLQFTLPGTVCLYYGSEVGMEGGDDPANRAPMRWDRVTPENAVLQLHRQLLKLRREQPALRYGDFRRLHSQKAFAFLRKTLSAKETLIVVANPTDQPIKEYLQLRDSKLQDVTPLRDLLGSKQTSTVLAGAMEVTLQPHEVVVFQPNTAPYPKGYDRYDRLP
jgi:cyclomaltodextrinase / maltogenic alpha-amylase / neopullulanase